MVTLPIVTVPGYAEALRHEKKVRDAAFLGGRESLCGIEVLPLTLRRLIWLEQAMNGLVVACQFENDDEALAHAIQVIYFCTPSFAPPTSPIQSYCRRFLQNWKQQKFIHAVLKRHTPRQVMEEVSSFLDDAFLDCPNGSGGFGPSHASYPAYLFDVFAAGGFVFTFDEVMDMPLKRLWQHWRVAVKRINPEYPLSNRSDDIFTKGLAQRDKEGRN